MPTATQNINPGLQWQGALRLLENRVFKIRTQQGHGTGFHIGNFGVNKKLCAIATAYHVISSAHDWGQPIKVIHAKTGKEVLLKEENKRAILTFPNQDKTLKDLAVILFDLPEDFVLPDNTVEIVSEGVNLYPGVDVGWCGFPSLKNDKLCFFHGYISCYLDQQGDYLVDGVAIHGVSGSPVFFINNQTNLPMIAGVITQYIPNRSTGESLPGVSMITSISPCEDMIKKLRDLDQAKKEEEEQKIAETKISEEPKIEGKEEKA